MVDEHDHRSLGQRLDLFHLQEEAAGSVFWHPKGWVLYRLLEARVREELARGGYQEVRSPQVLSQAIWEQSGHWQSFREDMLVLDHAALKPVSCPGHIQIAKRAPLSHHDLPLRLAELGLCHRNEASGALHGLFRLRQFCQDDGHIFCAEEQVADEVARFCAGLRDFYAAFGFPYFEVAFSSRPAQRAGDDAVWDRAEDALLNAAKRAGLEPRVQAGQGAFYGPKLEFSLRDRQERSWQCGTIQLDLVLPERFDLSYVDAGGGKRRPAILHRALFGSLERFLGILLEHHRGALPPWLAPEQVIVAPIGDGQLAYAREVASRLGGLRVRLDDRAESLARKIAEAQAPFVLVLGEREVRERGVSLRHRGGAQERLLLDQAPERLCALCAPP